MNRVYLSAALLTLVCIITLSWLLAQPDMHISVDKVAMEQATGKNDTGVTQANISYLDILDNPEFKQGVQHALRQDDKKMLDQLQQKAVEIGQVAGLSDQQMQMLQGKRGRQFITFNAKRQMFMEEFALAFKQTHNIDELKLKYPQARDLFSRADELIKIRDNNIIVAAKTLANGEDFNHYIGLAQEQWRNSAQSSVSGAENSLEQDL